MAICSLTILLTLSSLSPAIFKSNWPLWGTARISIWNQSLEEVRIHLPRCKAERKIETSHQKQFTLLWWFDFWSHLNSSVGKGKELFPWNIFELRGNICLFYFDETMFFKKIMGLWLVTKCLGLALPSAFNWPYISSASEAQFFPL